MHWCPYCSLPCMCDSDDTDYGEMIPDINCPHYLCDSEDEEEFEYDEEE